MIRLEQSKNYPSADTMAVEIEVLPLKPLNIAMPTCE